MYPPPFSCRRRSLGNESDKPPAIFDYCASAAKEERKVPHFENLHFRSSQKRLEDLLVQRASVPEKHAEIDAKIWNLFG